VTLRWRETDSNFRFLGEFRRDLGSPWRRGSGLRGRSPQPWVEFARDSPLEGDGFEPSVPRYDPTNFGFWGVRNFSANKSAAKSLLAFLSTPSSVEKLGVGSHGYDIPPFEKLRDFK
jgi:hypothetical protein